MAVYDPSKLDTALTSDALANALDKKDSVADNKAPAPATAVASPVSNEKVPETAGEKHFDRKTYLGIGWIANATLSVGIALGLAKTSFGQKKVLEPLASFIEETGGKYVSKWRDKTVANNVAQTGSLMIGGFTLMYPIKKLEDHKLEQVEEYNAMHGSGIADPEMERRSLERLQKEPKQSWSSILGSRSLDLGIVVGTVSALDKYVVSAFEKTADFLHYSMHSKDTLTRDGGNKRRKYVEEIDPKDPLKTVRKWAKPEGAAFEALSKEERFMLLKHEAVDLAVKDWAWSGYVATLLYATTRVLGGIVGHKREQSALHAAAAPAAADLPDLLPSNTPATPSVEAPATSLAAVTDENRSNNKFSARETAPNKKESAASRIQERRPTHLERAERSPSGDLVRV